MFRTIGKRLLLTKNRLVFIPTNGIVEFLPKRPKELNSVKLMGTIIDDVHYLKNGAINLRLKTANEDTSHCVHNVAIANRNLLKLVHRKLAREQRIYIGGRLKTVNNLIDYERYQEVEILANELYFLEPNPKITEIDAAKPSELIPVQMDENVVEMLAFVGTSVRNGQNFSVFSIVTHFIRQKGQSTESEDKEYHKVLIYKDPQMQQIAQDLQKFDQIYVTGFINYSKDKYPDGNEYENGFIQPTNLLKLQKFDVQD